MITEEHEKKRIYFVPYADALYEEGWILQQDGATPHTSAKTKILVV